MHVALYYFKIKIILFIRNFRRNRFLTKQSPLFQLEITCLSDTKAGWVTSFIVRKKQEF